MAGSGSSIRVVLAALVANFLIMVAKYFAFMMTGSKAMLAESFHSAADTGNQVLMLVGLRRAKLPPDQSHPYGYGKESYFWSFVVAVSIFVVGGLAALNEGIGATLLSLQGKGEMPTGVEWAIGVLSVSILVEGASFLVALKEFRKDVGKQPMSTHLRETRSSTILTVVFEDAAAVAGLVIALLGVVLTAWTGNPLFDALASVFIGIILLLVAVYLAFKTHQLLIGQSAPPKVEEDLRDLVLEAKGVRAVVELHTLHMGEDYILLNIGIQFNDNLNTADLETTIDAIERNIAARFPMVKRIFIEADSLKSGANRQVSADPDSD